MQDQFDKSDFSLSLISTRIIALVIQDGYVQYGKQIPYEKQTGDRIETHGVDRLLYRNGQFLGAIAGKSGDLLHTEDTVMNRGFPENEAVINGNYLLFSKDDPSYQKGISPVSVSRKSKPSDLARTGSWELEAPVQHTLYFEFPDSFQNKAEYQLTCKKGFIPDQVFTYNPRSMASNAIHMSQIGFRPDDPVKKAFLSCWMGSNGGLSYTLPGNFFVINCKTEKVMFKGKVVLSKAASDKTEDAYESNYNGTDVYEMDFSALNQHGEYRIFVQDVGCSHNFQIDMNVWEKAFIISTRGFYHQRSGIELGPPYTGFERPRPFSPEDGNVVYASHATLMETGNGLNSDDTNFGNLVNGGTSEIVDNAWGGYMDAGDWDRRIQHLEVTRLLLELFMIRPEYFKSINLNIPESKNSLPDIIDEALFNLDCYRRLQTDDGGIRGGIESEEHPRRGEGSWQESLTVYAYAPDIWSSYIYTGVAASASFILSHIDSDLSQIYRVSGIKAMEWAEKEYGNQVSEKYSNSIRDERNLAAAELFRLTGNSRWNTLFLKTTVFTEPGIKLYVWQKHEQRHAAWVYANIKKPGYNAAVRGFCMSAIIAEANDRLRICHRTGFKYTKDEWMPSGWGVFSAPDAVSLVRAHVLTGEEKYLKGIILACQSGLGANPLNLCYTTGVGYNNPQHVLHVDSRIMRKPPPPGITVFGPMDYKLQAGEGTVWALKNVRPYIFPEVKKWPAIECYWDVFWFPQICEFTVQSPMAKNAYTWGYLAARL